MVPRFRRYVRRNLYFCVVNGSLLVGFTGFVFGGRSS